MFKLMQDTGYQLVQHNGQRRFGPPPDWTGPPPPKGCEVFVCKLPREMFEDELVPIFSRVGKIYELRLMMNFSGSNRGYAFVTYTTPIEASRATKELNNFEVRENWHIGVVKSVDNCRLFIGNIPKNRTKEELLEELSKRVTDIVDVTLCNRRLNRGFAFVEFTSHRAAAMARRILVPGCLKLWDQEVTVDWAEPLPDVDEEHMQTVKVLYVRNLLIKTLPEKIQTIFETAINAKVASVKKMYDYGYVYFYKREDAELAIRLLQNTDIDGSNIEICWAKPVVRVSKHLARQNYARSPKDDEGVGSTCAGAESMYGSPADNKSMYETRYPLAPAKLDSMCKRYMWAPPVYEYRSHIDQTGTVLWVATVELPYVGLPLNVPRKIGPLITSMFYTMEQARVEAAEYALSFIIKLLHSECILCSSALQPVYQPIPICNCIGIPYPQIYTGPQTSTAVPKETIWH